MRLYNGLALALGVAAVSGACAAGTGAGGGGTGPATASGLPQVTCSTGSATPSTFATAAQTALNRALIGNDEARRASYEAALAQAQQGITAEPANALHYFQAGQAQVGLGNLPAADDLFDRAVQACPELATLAGEERQQAWARTFQSGLDAYNAGDTARAISQWQAATTIDSARADTWFNLGVVYTQRGDVDNAVASYRRALSAIAAAPADSASAEQRAAVLQGLVAAGTDYFQAEKFREAAGLFALVNREDPNNRDAWYNHSLALYKLEDWQALIPVATRLTQIDPLNYNARIILFSAYKGISDAARAANNQAVESQNRTLALNTLTAADGLPVQIEGLQVSSQGTTHTLQGQVKGAGAAAGTPITLDFTLYSLAGPIGTGTATVNAPAKDATADFTVTIQGAGPVTGYSYTHR